MRWRRRKVEIRYTDDKPAMLELYKIAIDEYHFQVQLNWSRSQYYLVLNLGITTAGTGILQIARGSLGFLVAGIFFSGLLCCGLSMIASRVQQRYYEQTRNHKALIEKALNLNELQIRTTPGMGATIRRLGRVTTFLMVMLGIIGLLDLAGIGVGIAVGFQVLELSR